MKKALTVVALLALLAVPFWAVAADGGQDICHQTGNGDYVAISVNENGQDGDGVDHDGHEGDIIPAPADGCPDPEPEPCADGDPRAQRTDVEEGPWSEWELNADNMLERTRTVTTTIVEYSIEYGVDCFSGIPKVEVQTETKEPPIELFNNCNRWVVKQGDVELEKGQWTLPFELETAQSSFWEGVISEPRRCLQTPDEPTLRIAGTCSDEGVGQIVGVLNLGDLGVALLIEGQGSQYVIDENGEFGPIPARPGNYTWTIVGQGDNGRVIKSGEFTVDKCYQTCDETFRELQDPTWSLWSEWEWDSDRGLFVQTRIKSTVVLAIDARNKETVCARGVIEETEERTRGPGEVLVGVSLVCHVPAGDGVVYQLTFSVTVEPAGGATVFFNGNEYTESTGGYIGFGRYDWSAEAAESFEIVGDDEGTVKLKRDDCNAEEPPEHPPTGADPNTALAVVTGLAGYALAGIGGSILFMKRRASR